MRLDLKAVPKMVGRSARERFEQCNKILEHTKWPLYLIGPSGSGKTHIALNLAKNYAKTHKVPAYYAQLSPDQTKTSLILGLRLVNGSLKPVKGMVAEAMESGGIVVIDEATHTTQEMLLMFNSILDRTSITSIGDETVMAKDSFRIIFCSNNSTYAGNVRLPQSFAQRVVAFNFDYPSMDDEVAIAKSIVNSEFTGDDKAPDSVVSYLTSFVREVRSESFPLSARNIAIGAIRLALMPKLAKPQTEYFSKGQNAESLRRTVVRRITGVEPTNAYGLLDPRAKEFMDFVSTIGVDQFKDAVLSSCMYHLDVDGSELNKDAMRNKLASTLI